MIKKYDEILEYFARTMPDAQTELHYSNEYELLVAVMLSAQCTDKRVNMVTPALFSSYPTIEALASATPTDVLRHVRSVSYPNAKSAHLVMMAQKVASDYGGKIPHTREELMRLPGVGRKTANVMLIVAFGEPAMPVDTHVFRVAARLGLTSGCKTPDKTEAELVRHIPREKLGVAHHWFILFGRYTCKAVKPSCGTCGLTRLCEYHKGQE